MEKGGDELYQVKVFQGFCIEDDMNDWLKEHKGINILKISHDSFQMDFDVYKTVVILYQELPSLCYIKRKENNNGIGQKV